MSFKVLAGDFRFGEFRPGLKRNKLLMSEKGGALFSSLNTYYASDIVEIEEITEENKVDVLGAAGWGAIGAVALGGAGLLAGLILGGRGKRVVFAIEFFDGRQALVQTDRSTWKKIVAERFDKQRMSEDRNAGRGRKSSSLTVTKAEKKRRKAALAAQRRLRKY